MIGWPLKTFAKLEIHWVDSTSSPGWHSIEEFNRDAKKSGGPSKIVSVGYFIDKTKKYTTIALAIAHDPQTDLVGKACDFMIIPNGCITKVKRLK